MLYYGFFVIFTGGILLAIYLCLVINWFVTNSWWPGAGGPPMAENFDGQKIIELVGSTTTCKYRKGDQEEYCVVCLSKYEEGEEVRELPRCKHSFHAPCIDKWFSSHFHCPLCRTPVDGNVIARSEMTEGVSDSAVLV